MLKVNLIGKRKREKRNRSWITWTALGVYASFILYFFGSVLYVVIRITTLNSQLQRVDQDTQLISREILSNNELISKFVLSKFILGKIDNLNANKFRYKDYLDQVANMMPPDISLINVDFSIPGWISVMATGDSVGSLKSFERIVRNQDVLRNTVFASVFTENVTKSSAGIYSLKLQFEIKKNGRK